MTKKTELNRRRFLAASAAAAGALAVPSIFPRAVRAAEEGKPDLAPVPDSELEQIAAAVPAEVSAKPKKPRRLLVFYRCEGFVHGSINRGNAALETMGETTGAYETVVSKDYALFDPGALKDFDAVMFNNTTHLKFDDEKRRAALMDFVKSGKGVCGIHAATDNFGDWPEAAAMMGGLFAGHPWGGGGTWAMQVEEPEHPINKGFGGQGFWEKDEIYKMKDPYSREHLRILLGLDMTKKENVPGREDNDNAISWVRNFDSGRVFYCSLGHNNHIFWSAPVLQHYLDGIQFAMGDLAADATPSAQLSQKPKICPAPPKPQP
jgi:type 1 glutamine amidotransferase